MNNILQFLNYRILKYFNIWISWDYPILFSERKGIIKCLRIGKVYIERHKCD